MYVKKPGNSPALLVHYTGFDAALFLAHFFLFFKGKKIIGNTIDTPFYS
jgi:hypothetical protein